MTDGADPMAFRALMARWATGVTVVTAHDAGADAGLTVNAFLSVSLTPPTVLVSLTRNVDTLPLIERSRRFAVNILAADQRPLSDRFASTRPSAEKFEALPLHRSASGIALLDGTLGSLECRVSALHPAFDHVLVVGEVEHQEGGRSAPPLLYYHSGYAEVDAEGRVRLPLPRRP
jgi:flavin reductase (DIM6/NTAB) family NADH-FMN oxidoreductase RutF